MNIALYLSALLMGLASSPHCIAMCGAACGGIARACGGGQPQQGLWAWQLGRLLSYSAAGALVAASVAALGWWSQLTPALRPLWVLIQLAALALGLWLVWRGQVPLWMQHMGQGVVQRAQRELGTVEGPAASMPRRRLGRAALLGTLWAAWPCGLLQAALVVAGLTATPLQGALAMACFAIGSGLGLWLGPSLWWRLTRGRYDAQTGPTIAVRVSGAMLAAVSAWAVGMSLWQRLYPAIC
jgi:uncharacterized protein